MDINKILEKISIRCEKDKKYLKGLFNKEKADLTEQFGDALTEDRLDMLSLIRVGKKYDINKAKIDEFIADNVEKVVEVWDENGDVVDMKTMDEAIFGKEESVDDLLDDTTMEYDLPDDSVDITEDFKDYFADIPDPVNVDVSDYERTPSLNIETGLTYILKLTEPKVRPYAHEKDGTWGPYTIHAWKVQLLKLSDPTYYDDIINYGEFEGQKAFVDGQKYTMWLDDKASGEFKMFWKKTTNDGLPDSRVFTFRKTKPAKYNVWSFGIPKER